MAAAIRERIERQLRTSLATISGVGTVYRWDGRGETSYATGDIFLRPLDDTRIDESMGNPGVFTNNLELEATAIIIVDQSSSDATRITQNTWLSLVESKLLADRYVNDGTRDLAVTLDIEAREAPEFNEGLAEATVRFSVMYQHDANNPNQLGTAIPESA